MNNNEIGAISVDMSNLLNTLLLYKLASKFLSKSELSIILEEGRKSISATLSNTIDKNMLDKILIDVEANIKNTISVMNK